MDPICVIMNWRGLQLERSALGEISGTSGTLEHGEAPTAISDSCGSPCPLSLLPSCHPETGGLVRMLQP